MIVLRLQRLLLTYSRSVLDKQQLLLLSVGVGITSFFAILAILASGTKTVYKKKGQLLLVNELRFLAAAMQALPADCMMTFKVRLLDLVACKSASGGKNMDRELADYSMDFVIVDRNTSEPKLCIEMLMEGRDTSGEAMIGRALRKSGIPHLKLPLVRYYDPIRLRQLFSGAMSGQMQKD